MKATARATELTVGISAKTLISYSFDYLLYPVVIYQLGITIGGLIMMLLSLLACLAMVKFYDWSKRDWLGIEALKGLKEYSGSSSAGRFTAWVLRRSEPVIFLFLSIKADPFITMTWLRRGAFSGMKRRDGVILVGSVAVGNAYWAVACWLGISVVEWIWRVVMGWA